jgi:hypothetical protein
MAQKGFSGGSSNSTFDSAYLPTLRDKLCGPGADCSYIFFEKKRIAEGKGKTPARLEKESAIRRRETEVILEYKEEEIICDEDDKGKLIVRETGKLFKII